MVFCIAPFVNFSTRTDGRIRACCQADEFKTVHAFDNDVQQIWRSDEWEAMRENFRNGEWPKECWRCRTNVEKGVSTRMNMENKRWEHLDWEKLKQDPEIHIFDLRMGNTCNLKCVMCSPMNSSLWWNEQKLFNHLSDNELKNRERYKWAMDDYLLDEVKQNLAGLQMLYFSGGEPLLIKKHKEIIEECIAQGVAGNIALVYDTNATMIDEYWIERWSHFKEVQINFSIDGGREVVEYIRYPVKYDDLIQSMELLKDITCKVFLQFSLAAYNIFEVDTIIALKNHYGFKGINISLVYWPDFLSAHHLPDAIKEQAMELYKDCEVRRVRDYVNTFTLDGSNLDEMCDYFAKIDQSRGLNYKDIFKWID